MLIKKDGRREAYDRYKVVEGLKKACEKRPVSMSQIEEFVDSLERELQDMGEREVPITLIGEKVMEGLRHLDDVAYVRFASVYREFKDVNDFVSELRTLLSQHDK